MSNTKNPACIFIRNVKVKKKTKLKFRDNEGHDGFDITTNVVAGGKVEWRLEKRCGLGVITEIKFEDDSIFKGEPRFNRCHTKVTGIIKKDVKGDYKYTVSCKMRGNEVIIQDPILKIKPPTPPVKP